VNDSENREVEDREVRLARLAAMDRAELEGLTIEAIKAHRRTAESDQLLFDDWLKTAEDSTTPVHVRQALQDQYFHRQKKTGEQVDLLGDMIEALGYVPDVPDDD
jgi:hypothetical protein